MKYIKELEKLGHALFDQTEYDFKLNVFADSSNGYITEPFGQSRKKQVVVGAKDLFKDSLVGKNDVRKFTTGLVCLYHEHTHFEQFGDIRIGCAEPDIAYSFMARQNNDALYFLNYKNMVHELDAEHQGIMKAYAYIKDNHPELDADKCIKDHISYKLSIGDTRYASRSFGDPKDLTVIDFSKCKDISEIDDMFKTLRKCVNESGLETVQIMRTYNSPRAKDDKNLLFDMFDEDNKNVDIFKTLPNSQEQLKFVSAYCAEKCPERSEYFKNYVVISCKDYLDAYDEIIKDNANVTSAKRGSALVRALSDKDVSSMKHISRADICGYDDSASFAASFDDVTDASDELKIFGE